MAKKIFCLYSGQVRIAAMVAISEDIARAYFEGKYSHYGAPLEVRELLVDGGAPFFEIMGAFPTTLKAMESGLPEDWWVVGRRR